MNGWHKVYGMDVFVRDGRVIRGLSVDGQKTVYPYKLIKQYGWTEDCPTLAGLRAGISRGTKGMF